MKKIYMIVLAVIAADVALAQDSTQSKQLDEVVITGQYKPQSLKNSVYQVKVITKEKILKLGAVKLQDVLSNELNIRFSQDPATGGSDITMLGLKGTNVKILIDGLPMVGRQGTSNEININQIDVNSIERIEIVEGPMSVVYGADALAGVINIITKKAGASKISVMAKVQEETVGNEYGIKQGIHNQYVGLTFRHGGWEFGGSFGYNYFGGWKGDSTGRELAWHWKDQIIGNGFIGYSSHRLNLRYRFDGLDEIITNPGNYTITQRESGDTFALDQEYLTHRQMHQLQGSYFANNNLSFQAQSSYTDYSRQVYSTVLSKNTGKFSQSPDPSSQSIVKFTGFTFRGTAHYKISSFFALQPGVDINLESGKGERLKQGNNTVNDYAFFITSEITPNARINIRPGFRFIKNSVYDAPPLIPSVNAKFALSKHLDLRLAYARGFRSPTLRELYFDFNDVNHHIVGNPDLKAETSHSLTGSFTWQTTNRQQSVFTTTLSGFYNDVKNMIDYALSANDPSLFILTNVSNSKTAGLSLIGSTKYKALTFSLGGAYTGFYNSYSETDKSLPTMQWSAEINSSVSYNFSKLGMNLNFFYKFTGKRKGYALDEQQNLIIPTRLKGYHWGDLTLNKSLFRLFTLNAGIRNLFDVKDLLATQVVGGAHSASGSQSIGYGRSYFLGLTFNWDKK